MWVATSVGQAMYGNFNGTWSINNQVLTIRLDGADNVPGEAFARAIDFFQANEDKMFGNEVSRPISIDGSTMIWTGVRTLKRVGQ